MEVEVHVLFHRRISGGFGKAVRWVEKRMWKGFKEGGGGSLLPVNKVRKFLTCPSLEYYPFITDDPPDPHGLPRVPIALDETLEKLLFTNPNREKKESSPSSGIASLGLEMGTLSPSKEMATLRGEQDPFGSSSQLKKGEESGNPV